MVVKTKRKNAVVLGSHGCTSTLISIALPHNRLVDSRAFFPKLLTVNNNSSVTILIHENLNGVGI